MNISLLASLLADRATHIHISVFLLVILQHLVLVVLNRYLNFKNSFSFIWILLVLVIMDHRHTFSLNLR